MAMGTATVTARAVTRTDPGHHALGPVLTR